MHYLLIYDVVDNYTELRKPHRAAHFEHAQKSFDAGEMVLAGALDEPVDGAILVFRAADPSAPARFAENDPYVRAGIVKSWRVRKWNTVLGDGEQLPKL